MRTKEENRLYMREWHRLHPNYAAEYMLEWRERNPDYFKDYFQTHKEQSVVRCRKYKQTHPDQIREYRQRPEVLLKNSQYQKANIDKLRPGHRERDRRRRALILGCVGSFTREEWDQKLAEFNFCCAYCSISIVDKPVAEHMIPLSRGGSNTIDNIVPSCWSCNAHKRTKTSDEYLLSRSAEKNNNEQREKIWQDFRN